MELNCPFPRSNSGRRRYLDMWRVQEGFSTPGAHPLHPAQGLEYLQVVFVLTFLHINLVSYIQERGEDREGWPSGGGGGGRRCSELKRQKLRLPWITKRFWIGTGWPNRPNTFYVLHFKVKDINNHINYRRSPRRALPRVLWSPRLMLRSNSSPTPRPTPSLHQVWCWWHVRHDMTCKSFVFKFLSSILRENILKFTIISLTGFFLSTVLLKK